METLSSQVLREFGLKNRGIQREKSSYVCVTDKGVKILQKSRSQALTVEFMHYVKEELFKNGFHNTDRFLVSEKGKPYAEHDGELYIATNFLKAEESRFDDHGQMKEIVKTVALMHKIANKPNFYKNLSVFPVVNNEGLGTFAVDFNYGKLIKTMNGYKKTVVKQRRFSDFDIMFLKQFKSYDDRIKKSMEIYENSGLAATPGGGRPGFCHNLLKEETVLRHGGRVYITNFSESGPESYLYDLAQIIKRHIKTGRNPLPLGEILAAYDRENPLSRRDLSVLHAILLIPDKFYKICIKYYSKKRTWTPASFEGIIEELAKGSDAYERYIDGYFKP